MVNIQKEIYIKICKSKTKELKIKIIFYYVLKVQKVFIKRYSLIVIIQVVFHNLLLPQILKVIVLIQNKTIIHLKNQSRDRIIIKNQHNLLNKIKIMLNKVKKKVIVMHGENRIIMKNQHNLLNKNNTRKWNKITNNIVYQKTKY